MILSIDLETYSSVSLKDAGVYPYVESEDFKVLLMAYAWEDEPVKVIDLARGEAMPEQVREALTSPQVIKMAYNAQFERACLSRYLGVEMEAGQWRCTAVWARMAGLPGSLESVCEVLGLEDIAAKDKAGKALIGKFCKPHQVRGCPGQSVRVLPEEDLIRWEQFRSYCQQDVVAEREVRRRLEGYPIPEEEQKLWELDQRINERGIAIDRQLVNQILEYDKHYKKHLLEEAQGLTGLTNPNSPKQLLEWLRRQGLQVEGLRNEQVLELLDKTTGKLHRVLAIRQALSKTSISKYQAMEQAVGRDGRIRGTLQFYGAARSGRWAGRLVQVHNLPQNKLKDLELARDLVRAGDFETLELLFGESAFVLSQLVRTALVPKERHRFIIADFSAIEARVVAWLADEKWRQEVFAGAGKIYEASASRMFGVPEEEIGKGSSLRQKGKIAELACGYGGGVKALQAMGGEAMGLEEEEMARLIQEWRQANTQIVALWKKCEQSARAAVETGWPQSVAKGVEMSYEGGILWVKLPSGRRLAYREAALEGNTFTYSGVHPTTKKWSRLTTYGGKWTENIVQAIARDCLGVTMMRLAAAGYTIVMHVHDEVILEVREGIGSLEEVEKIMSQQIAWASGLHLSAEGYETDFYRKD